MPNRAWPAAKTAELDRATGGSMLFYPDGQIPKAVMLRAKAGARGGARQ